MAGWLVEGPGPPLTPAPAHSLRVGEHADRVWSGARGCLPAVLTLAPTPGPSWTATFDPVPTNALAGSQDSGDKELCSGPPVSQGPLCMPQDLPAPNGAGPAAPNALQLR